MKRVSTVTVRKRLVTVFLFGLCAFIIMTTRLGYVQFIIGEELMEKADESWSRDIVFEPERGNILDVNGQTLVENVSAPSVVVVPRQIKNKQDTANKLAQILEMPTEKLMSTSQKMLCLLIFI